MRDLAFLEICLLINKICRVLFLDTQSDNVKYSILAVEKNQSPLRSTARPQQSEIKTAPSDGTALTASGDSYTIGEMDFTLTLDNGISQASYINTTSGEATLINATYSFTVETKPVEVVVQKNGAISSVNVNS